MQTVKHPLASRFTAPMSKLGFDGAPLLAKASRKDSLAVLEAAFDAGVTFFDTARSYGDGQGERLLGEFLAEKREKVVLCTKFGIQPPRRNWKQPLRPVVRMATRLVPSLRQAVRRRTGDRFLGGSFSVADLQVSFERSLRELKTEYVDMLMLHAPPLSVLEQTDLYGELEKLVEQGKARAVGIAGQQSVVEAAFHARIPVLQSAQFALNPSNIAFAEITRKNEDLLLVADHPFAGGEGFPAIKKRVDKMSSDEALPEALRRKLAGGAKDPQLVPELVFGMILSGTGVASTLAEMVSPRHLRSCVEAIESCRFTASELEVLRASFSATVAPRRKRAAAL